MNYYNYPMGGFLKNTHDSNYKMEVIRSKLHRLKFQDSGLYYQYIENFIQCKGLILAAKLYVHIYIYFI